MQLHSAHFTPTCIAFIKQWQGLSLEKYQDKKGIWVIGYGHEITADENFDKPISVMQADKLLLADLYACEALILNDLFQQEALIAWILSIGMKQFCTSEMGSLIFHSQTLSDCEISTR